MKKLNTGVLVAIEGIDGSGKSLFSKLLFEKLKLSYSCILTQEPGGTELGKKLREILQRQKEAVSQKSEYLLFASDRAQHFEEIVIPNLQLNKVVLSDRLGDSSLCYQGFGRGLDKDLIKQINSWAMDLIEPDLIFYLDLDIKTAFERISKRNEDLTAFEKHELMKRVKTGYEEIYKDRANVYFLDANLPPQQIVEDANNLFRKFVKEKKYEIS